jgi:transcriptional regulator GlxA family with amidase domain
MKDLTAGKRARTKSIGILGFEGISVADVAGPLEALAAARTDVDGDKIRACYDARLIAVGARTFRSESNLVLTAKETLSQALDLDTVIIPGGIGIREGETRRKVVDWLLANSARLNRIVSVCTGIYPLAQSGLIEGRKIATHWRFAQDVARRFPKIRVDPSASFLKDGPFYTCGGGNAATELTLALIDEDYGPRVALAVAREVCTRLRPLGDHNDTLDPSQFVCGPSDRLAELPAWIAGHLNDNLSVEVLAERACLCPRHFSRLFKRVFRSTPANFVETLRIDEARRQLLQARVSVESVAAAVGFKDSDSFRRAFERRLGVNPGAFRKRRFSIVVDRNKTATSHNHLSKLSALTQKAGGRHKDLAAAGSMRLRHARAS